MIKFLRLFLTVSRNGILYILPTFVKFSLSDFKLNAMNQTRFFHRLLFISLFLCMATVLKAEFTHPGGVTTIEDLERMKAKVKAKESPWIDGWNLMLQDYKSSNTYKAVPKTNIGGSGIRQQASRDATAAMYNIIRWYVSGDVSYAECAIKILNDWSASIQGVVSGELFQLPIEIMVQAAEVARIYPGWKAEDQERFKNMCLNYFYPACHSFIGECGSWSGWDGPANSCLLYIGLFCDNQTIFDEAIEYYKNGNGGGALLKMVCQPSGQIAEMGRDMPHAEIGPSAAAEFCLTAYNQGIDLFSYSDNRLLAAFEYLCKYNLEHKAVWVPYNDCVNNHFYSPSVRYGNRITGFPGCEIIYNHYVVRKGLSAPYTKAMVNLRGVVANTWEAQSYTALSYTLDADKSPYTELALPAAPSNLKAAPGISRVTLTWDSPGWDQVNGSVIQRATTADGLFTTIGTWDLNTTSEFVDSTAKVGMTYYYRVVAKNNTGIGAYSSTVSAAAVSGRSILPAGWLVTDVGKVGTPASALYYDGNSRSFVLRGSGTSFGSTSDMHSYLCTKVTGDYSLVIRLNDYRLSGTNADRIGLIMRESLSGSSRMAAIGLADDQCRYVWFSPRVSAGSSASWIKGCTHNWPPLWFKIERSGNTFKAFQSGDGMTWHLVGSTLISMPATYYAGVYLTSGSSASGVATSAIIDHVTLVKTGSTGTAIPADFSATAVNSSRVNLSWSSAKGAMTYCLKRATSPEGPYTVLDPMLSDTLYTDSLLTSGTTYYYALTSSGFEGESADSALTFVTMPELALPQSPTGFEAVPGNNTVNLVWNATDEATAYAVKRATTKEGPYNVIATVSDLFYSDQTVTEGSTYYYRLAGVNLKGEGASTSPDSVTVSASVKLSGELIGTSGSFNENPATTIAAGMDLNFNTYFYAHVSDDAWVGLDMGVDTRAIVTQVRYAPRSGYTSRMIGGCFQGASMADFCDAETLFTVTSNPPVGLLTRKEVKIPKKYRYLRYLSPAGSWGNVSEIQFWGHAVTADEVTDAPSHETFMDLRVTPNPFVDQLVITLDEIQGPTEVKLFNHSGQVMYATTFAGNSAVLNTRDLLPGLYLLKIKNKNGVSVRKLMK